MKRGAIWTAATGRGYTGKPRPVVIVQDDRFDATDSITIVPMTSDPMEALFRIFVEPNDTNGLRVSSHVMVDKVMTVRKEHLGRRLGNLASSDMRRIDRAILVFLGLAG